MQRRKGERQAGKTDAGGCSIALSLSFSLSLSLSNANSNSLQFSRYADEHSYDLPEHTTIFYVTTARFISPLLSHGSVYAKLARLSRRQTSDRSLHGHAYAPSRRTFAYRERSLHSKRVATERRRAGDRASRVLFSYFSVSPLLPATLSPSPSVSFVSLLDPRFPSLSLSPLAAAIDQTRISFLSVDYHAWEGTHALRRPALASIARGLEKKRERERGGP